MKDFVLQVFGELVEVQHVDGLKESESFMGDYDVDLKLIRLDSNLEGDDYWKTLIHELGHAIFDRGGGRQGVDSQAEEILVDQIAVVICENFKLKIL